MYCRIFKRKIINYQGLFDGHFIDVKAFYALEFDRLACVSFIGELDTTKTFAFISEALGNRILSAYQHSYFDHGEQKMVFNNTIFVIADMRMIELGNNYCQVLHTTDQFNWANSLIKDLAVFKIVNHENVIGFARPTAMN